MSEFDNKYVADLVERTRLGDSDAFAELYAATVQKQYRFAFRYLKEAYLAQDALQQVYVLVFKNLDSLKDTKLFIPWLDQLNFRVCFRMQQEQRQYENQIHAYMNRSGDIAFRSEDTPFCKKEQKKLLGQILNLPYPESQVLLLKYFNQLEEAEIARMMEVSVKAVRRYLTDGTKKLGTILKEK